MPNPRWRLLQIPGGDFAGQYPVLWMFQKPKLIPELLAYLLQKEAQGKTFSRQLLLTLIWLAKVGEKTVPTAICPYCNEAPVRKLSIIGKPTEEGSLLASCDNFMCYQKMSHEFRQVGARSEDFRFSLLREYSGDDREALAQFYNWAYDLGDLGEILPAEVQNLFASVSYRFNPKERGVSHEAG